MWIVQALERDIAAAGPDIPRAKEAFEQTVSGYLQLAARHHSEPLAVLMPAPQHFWEIWTQLANTTVAAERMPSMPAFMLPVVTYDPLPA